MLQQWGNFFAAVALALGLVAATTIGARAIVRVVRIKQHDQTISVTGSARRRIRSDLVVWRAHVSARAPERGAAYTALAAAVPRVRGYLQQHGIPAAHIVVGSVHTSELHARNNEGEEIPEQTIAYVLSQTVEVTSRDVDGVTRVSRDVTELINQGIAIESDAPQYIYTGLAELKIRLLAEASRDARVRAEQIATSTNARLGALATGRMGVIQVNAANETAVSAEGVNDTTSIEKDALAVVSAVFYTE